MKIADLFVALGFKTEGAETLPEVERKLVKAEMSAVKLLAGVTALNGAFLYMMKTATDASVALQKFFLISGLSTQELQKWQMAAKLGNVEGNELAATILTIQKAQADLKLGQGNIAPWQFFGLSIRQTPFQVLKQLHDQFQTMDPAIARTMASQLGISENLFQWLRRDNLELETLNANLRLTEEQQKSLNTLNRVWQELVISVLSLKNRLAETFAGPMAMFLRVLQTIVNYLGQFVDWLNRGTVAATGVRWALVAVVALFLAAGAALTVFVTVLGAVIAAMKLLTVVSLPILAAIAPIVIVLGIMAAALTTLIVLIDDFWTQCKGGKSAFDWNDNLILTVKNVERLAALMQWFIDRKDILKTIGEWTTPQGIAGKAAEFFSRDAAKGSGKPADVHQTNHVDVHIDGATDPKTTGREAGRSIKQAILEAAYQMPLATV